MSKNNTLAMIFRGTYNTYRMLNRSKLWKKSFGYSCPWPIILLLIGCAPSSRTMSINDLENADPAVRIMAIKWAAQEGAVDAVPLLVDRLQEQDIAVRLFAIEALRRIVGTDHGYDYKADAAARAEAVERWRKAISTPRTSASP